MCNRVETKNPAADAPVRIKNFLSAPPIFPFRVKHIKAIPNKEKIINGNKKTREPLNNSLTAGIKNSLTIKRKAPINAQNISIRDFAIILFYQKIASTERRIKEATEISS